MNGRSFSPTAIRELLAAQPLFANMSRECIERMLEGAQEWVLEAGVDLVREGDPAAAVFVIIDGALEVFQETAAQDLHVATSGAGDVVGEMGVLTGMPRNATVRASTRSTVLCIEGEAFTRALQDCPGAMLVALQLMIGRLRSVETELVQHHKMAALGVLAAGLAHELNNPASALQRGADLLQQAVPWWEACAERVGAQLLGSDPDLLDHLRDELAQAATVSAGDPIEQSDRIQEVEEWLAQQGLERPWEIAPAIVDAGYSRERLVELAGRVAPGAVPPLLSWLASGATVRGQLRAVAASSAAISGIVSAVKAYTRLDQAPIQDVDIHESLEQSLTIMRYQLRSVSVYRRFAERLPLITAYASELNQVWTNLISNAIDAMGGGGDLTISTGIDEQDVTVAFEDTGPGIPEEIRPRLFEPFFTTKAPGKGTGMGLAISYSIVRRHGGDIKVESRPGRTVFTVRIPLAGVST